MSDQQDVESARRRLDDAEERIREVERDLKEEEGDDGPKFHDSGTIRPQDDDQSIAPPG
jgi:hypothetical protein